MGGYERATLVVLEPSLEYHPCYVRTLTTYLESGRGTVVAGQFDWGGLLLKGNGGVQRLPQPGWQSGVEHKGIRELNCETDGSSRCESRA